MSNRRITVEFLAGGQQRAYADHVYRYRMSFEVASSDGWLPSDVAEVAARSQARAVHSWEDKAGYFDPKLSYLRRVGPGVWEFEVTEAFTD